MKALNVVVAGIGNRYRGDDAVGPMVASSLADVAPGVRDIGPLEEPLDLLGRFDGVDLVIVIDAVRSGAPIGDVRVLEVAVSSSGQVGDVEPEVTSTHGIGLVGVLRLAHAIGHAPQRLFVVTVEGEAFALGSEMSAAVVAAVPAAISAVATVIERERSCA
jgi:hydrogenase maturation protease